MCFYALKIECKYEKKTVFALPIWKNSIFVANTKKNKKLIKTFKVKNRIEKIPSEVFDFYECILSVKSQDEEFIFKSE